MTIGEPKEFSFYTSLTLQPENFVLPLLWRGWLPPPGTPLSGEITLWGGGDADVLFEIINPNIVSEDQFGFYYRLGESTGRPPLGYGHATNSIPEPSTMILIGSGLVGLWRFRWKLRKT